MIRVLVTGANGFVGRKLCSILKRAGYFVRGAVRKAIGVGIVECDEIVEIGDIGAGPDWSTALKAVDVVVHLAARAHILKEKESDPLKEYRRVNVRGTECLAKACLGEGVKRIVFLSSIGVNGELTSGKAFTEDDAPSPRTLYALSKLEAEQALAKIASARGFEYTIIRSPLVYGPNVPGNFLRLMNAVNAGIPLPLAKVNNARSFINLENLVDIIMLCIIHPNAANQLFLVSDCEDISTSELIECISAGMGKKPRTFSVPNKWVRGFLKLVGKPDIADKLYGSLQIDSAKASDRLGWKPPVSMQDGLRSAGNLFPKTV